MRITSSVLCSLTVLFVIASQSDAVTQQDLSDFNDAVDREALDELNEILSDTPTTENINDNSSSEVVEPIRPRFFGKKDEDEDLGMDTLTIIWYLTTFTALFGFFIVMACTDNTCNRRRMSKPAETHNPTPSPCPSYKHFAPPSYGSVMKKLKEQKIYIVPVHESNNSFFNHPTGEATSPPATSSDIEKGDAITVPR